MKKTKAIYILSIFLLSAFSFAGCSTRNILTPGKDKSDCELASGTAGVCGSPRSIYKAEDKIDGLGKGTDQSYFIHKDGTIQEIKNGELGNIVKVKTLANGEKVAVKEDGDGGTSDVPLSSLKFTNLEPRNSFLFGAGHNSTMIRNQEVIREAWINTYEDPNGNLAVEHNIMIVTKKPSWAVGEKTPRNIRKVKMIPSYISKGIVLESHNKGDIKDDIKLKTYLDNVSETPIADKKLKKYLKGL